MNKKFVAVWAIVAGICLIILGIQNIYFFEKYPHFDELIKISDKIDSYNCDSRVGYNDSFNFTLKKISQNIDVIDVEIKCSSLNKRLRLSNWYITVWVDNTDGLYKAYALKVGEINMKSSRLGVVNKEFNLLSLILIVFGSFLTLKNCQYILRKKSVGSERLK
ncbi:MULTISPECIES: hypothetical protein [Thalassotalea]|uniref:DUF3592 domain-containing protein n=1 Tax=Thalassotalea castellviae TaxID=3075612 RepID=A0ABU3A5C1_9GAMM|nr:hypothetical protein [Thalassotalea sp. W431]MDT0605382.1 hypothetical protein [Thalassotalea sp. W431]